MKVALYGQLYSQDVLAPVEELLDELSRLGAQVAMEAEFAEFLGLDTTGLQLFTMTGGLDSSFDLMVSFGGDGTILRAITFIRDLGIPVVGVNTGRLGSCPPARRKRCGR